MSRALQSMLIRKGDQARGALRAHGWDVRRFDPDASIWNFVPYMTKLLQIDCVIDVGAHYGEFALHLRRNGYTGRIVSFEPVAQHFAKLAATAKSDRKWTVSRFALGSDDGSLLINASSKTTSSFLTYSEYGNVLFADRSVRKETVEVRKLDTIIDRVAERSARIYLKTDAQGWDLEVLKGARNCVDRMPAIQAELALKHVYMGSPGWLEYIDFARELGYEISAFFPVFRDATMRLGECDCVLVRTDCAGDQHTVYSRVQAKSERP